jgi:hypothetical protein
MRMLSKGVRNFVMSDETSFSEAMAEARSEEELAATAHQLDAFHKTFNFCMTCRQYTCSDCWNVAEGRCLTCAPVPGQVEPVFQPSFGATAPGDLLAGAEHDGHGEVPAPPGIEAWPEADLPADRLARVLDLPAEAAPEPAPGAIEGHEATEAMAAEPAPDATEQHVRGIAPGQSLDDAIAAYEAMLAGAEPAMTAETAMTAEPMPEAAEPMPEAATLATEPAPVAEPAEPIIVEPEPVVAAPEPVVAAPEPITAAPEPAAPEPPMAVPSVPAADDRVAQPTWPVRPAEPAVPAPPARPAEPAPAAPANPWLRVAPEETSAPQWPAVPGWSPRTGRTEAPLTLAGRPLLPQGDASALWAASAQEVLGAAPAPLAAAAPAPAQPCVSCGLSLSANARFCRRCGSRQG